MKKLKYLVFLLITVLCVTGCGKKTDAAQELKDAFLKMKGTEAISLKASITMGSDEMKIPYVVDLSYSKDGMHMSAGVTLFGMEQKEEIYMLKTGDEVYTYIYDMEEGMWSYTKGSTDLGTVDMDDMPDDKEIDETIDKLIGAFDEVKKVKSDKDGYEKYEMSISKKTLLESAKEDVENEEELKEIDESFKDFPDALTFTIYLKDGEVSIISMDLSNIEIPTDELPEGMNMKLFDFTIELVARNENVRIEIPKSVEESATYIDSSNLLDQIQNSLGEM